MWMIMTKMEQNGNFSIEICPVLIVASKSWLEIGAQSDLSVCCPEATIYFILCKLSYE